MSEPREWWVDDFAGECCRPRYDKELPHGMYEAIDKRAYVAIQAKLDEATKLLEMADKQAGNKMKDSYWPAWAWQYEKWKGEK